MAVAYGKFPVCLSPAGSYMVSPWLWMNSLHEQSFKGKSVGSGRLNKLGSVIGPNILIEKMRDQVYMACWEEEQIGGLSFECVMSLGLTRGKQDRGLEIYRVKQQT